MGEDMYPCAETHAARARSWIPVASMMKRCKEQKFSLRGVYRMKLPKRSSMRDTTSREES
jgi:hypothetical protein